MDPYSQRFELMSHTSTHPHQHTHTHIHTHTHTHTHTHIQLHFITLSLSTTYSLSLSLSGYSIFIGCCHWCVERENELQNHCVCSEYQCSVWLNALFHLTAFTLGTSGSHISHTKQMDYRQIYNPIWKKNLEKMFNLTQTSSERCIAIMSPPLLSFSCYQLQLEDLLPGNRRPNVVKCKSNMLNHQ